MRPSQRRMDAAAVTAGALRQRLPTLPESEREAVLVTLVQEEVSVVLWSDHPKRILRSCFPALREALLEFFALSRIHPSFFLLDELA